MPHLRRAQNPATIPRFFLDAARPPTMIWVKVHPEPDAQARVFRIVAPCSPVPEPDAQARVFRIAGPCSRVGLAQARKAEMMRTMLFLLTAALLALAGPASAGEPKETKSALETDPTGWDDLL